jgi:hypothetical protein
MDPSGGTGPDYTATASFGLNEDGIDEVTVSADRISAPMPLPEANTGSFFFDDILYPYLRVYDCMIAAGQQYQCGWGGAAKSLIPYAIPPAAKIVGPVAAPALAAIQKTAVRAGISGLATVLMQTTPEVIADLGEDLSVPGIETLDTRADQIWEATNAGREQANAWFEQAVENLSNIY